MQVFEGTIRLEDGDRLRSSLTVDSDRFVVAVGEHEIGDWAVKELSVERRNGEFHIGVEGEELVLTVSDPFTFGELLGISDKKPKQRKAKKAKTKRKKKSPPAESAPEPAPVAVASPPAQPVEPAGEERTAPAEEVQPSGPSLWQRIPVKWKLIGFGVIGLLILTVLFPTLVALLMMLVGIGTLFLAIAAKSESSSAIMPPAFFATTAASIGGIALVLLAAIIIVIS